MAVPPQSQQAIAPQSANSTSETDHNTAPAAETITLLENRLRRLEFALTGDASSAGDPTRPSATSAQGKASTVAARLGALEEQLRRLKSDSPVVGQVLELYTRYPDLFQTASPDTLPTTLDPSSLAALILAHAPAYHETASRLTSLKDIPIPPSTSSTTLIALQPRIDKALKVQEEQMKEVAELRARSAKIVQRWIEVGVVAGGECWSEWEERIRDVEREVRRREFERNGDEAFAAEA